MAVTLKENNGDFVLLLYGEPDSGSSEKLKNNTASGLDSTRLQQLKERGQTKILPKPRKGSPMPRCRQRNCSGWPNKSKRQGLLWI